jgi:hypothetical protein
MRDRRMIYGKTLMPCLLITIILITGCFTDHEIENVEEDLYKDIIASKFEPDTVIIKPVNRAI